MSLFGKIFGRKEAEAPSTQESIQKLRDTEEMLIKKQDFLEKKIKDVRFIGIRLVSLARLISNSAPMIHRYKVFYIS